MINEKRKPKKKNLDKKVKKLKGPGVFLINKKKKIRGPVVFVINEKKKKKTLEGR